MGIEAFSCTIGSFTDLVTMLAYVMERDSYSLNLFLIFLFLPASIRMKKSTEINEGLGPGLKG